MSPAPDNPRQLLWGALQGSGCFPGGSPERGWSKCPACSEYGLQFCWEGDRLVVSCEEGGCSEGMVLETLGLRPDEMVARDVEAGAVVLLTGAELLALRSPSFLIEGVLPDYGQALLIGKPEAFKSFLALDWAASIAAGVPWLGRNVSSGWVVYIAAEGSRGLRDRYAAWLRARGLDQVERIRFLPDAVDLLDGAVLERVRRAFATLPEPPALVVVDTVSRVMPGADENSARDVGAFIAALDGVAPAWLGVHHTRREDDEERGSGALRGGANMMAKMRRDAGTLRAVLSCAKMRDADRWPDVKLALERTGPSLVVAESRDAVPADDLRERIIAALAEAGPLSLNALQGRVGRRRQDVAATLQDLAGAGVTEKTPDGWRVVPESQEPAGTTQPAATLGVVPARGSSRREPPPGTTPAPDRFPEPATAGTRRNGGPPTLLEVAGSEDALVEMFEREFDAIEVDEDPA